MDHRLKNSQTVSIQRQTKGSEGPTGKPLSRVVCSNHHIENAAEKLGVIFTLKEGRKTKE